MIHQSIRIEASSGLTPDDIERANKIGLGPVRHHRKHAQLDGRELFGVGNYRVFVGHGAYHHNSDYMAERK